MAITNGYCTLVQYKAWALADGSTDATDDTEIELMIESASRHIDGQTGRTFYARTETRKYDVPDGRTLKLDDDLLTVTTFSNGDGTEITSANYILLPANVSPKYAIKLTEATSVYWLPDSSNNTEQAIDVAGTWGYASTAPHEIRLACEELTKAFYGHRTGQNMSMVAKVTAAGVVLTPQGTPDWVAQTLAKYRRRS